MNSTLFIIPARGGSKRLPGKNIKPFFGKPLIIYSLEFARKFVNDDQICITTDCEDIIHCVAKFGYKCQFIRPKELSNDTAKTDDVLRHAMNYYSNSFNISRLVLLQPTTPFREMQSLAKAINLFSEKKCDLIISCKKTKSSPYTHLFEKTVDDYLLKSKVAPSNQIPDVFEVNGSLYIIDANRLKEADLYQFDKIRMVEMSHYYSTDIDTQEDWDYAEFLVNSKKIHLES